MVAMIPSAKFFTSISHLLNRTTAQWTMRFERVLANLGVNIEF